MNVTQLQNYCVTIIDVNDDCAIAHPVREDLYRSYPDARMAHLKSGGNFPYLSRSDDVNLHLQVHLRRFDRTNYQVSDTHDLKLYL